MYDYVVVITGCKAFIQYKIYVKLEVEQSMECAGQSMYPCLSGQPMDFPLKHGYMLPSGHSMDCRNSHFNR